MVHQTPLIPPPPAEETDLRRLRLLVVDEDPVARHMMRDVLRALGVGAVYEAHDTDTTFAALEAYRIDGVLAELTAGDSRAIDIARRVRMANSNTPVLMVAGRADKHLVLRAADAGVVDFIMRPIDAERLYTCLAALP